MELLTLGVVGPSRRRDERRVSLHPEHFDRIPDELRSRILFERGYGDPFGLTDRDLEGIFRGVADRKAILESSGVVLLPRPRSEDLGQLRPGGIHWGWSRSVRRRAITQAAVDRRLTLIGWESMFTWKRGERDMYLFHRHEEMAGYCAVLHALEIMGLDGLYGPPLSAVVLGLRSASRGAIDALRRRGIHDITVYTRRLPWALSDEVAGCRYGHMVRPEGSEAPVVEEPDGRERPLLEALSQADVVVNGIPPDPDPPFPYLREGQERFLKKGGLIVDVCCRERTAFPFARPTTFRDPTFRVEGATYYAVDYPARYLWRSATWEISRVVVPYLEIVLGGPEAWVRNETIRRAINIREGVIRNPKICACQRRAERYPHEPIGRGSVG
jgi:alanine dehydrogenase